MAKNNQGLALLIVIGLVLMLSILGIAAFMISSGHFSTTYDQIKRAKAYYTAEAGVQHALWMCRSGNLPAGCDLANGCSGTWPISVDINLSDIGNVGIKILQAGANGAPAGTHPIAVTVNY